MDQDMISFFVNEVKLIRDQMANAISRIIQAKMEKSEYFEECGQLVDRIYGTASTLGFFEISEYTKAVKEVSYMASASDNVNGKKKAVKFLIKYIELSDAICDSIYDKEEIKKINHLLNMEKSRAGILNRKEFSSIEKKSCNKGRD